MKDINVFFSAWVASMLLFVTMPLMAISSQPIQDTAITAQVKSALSENYDNIEVTTTDGIVMLSGTVNASEDAGAVIEKTESVDGVKDINTNKLYINGSDQLMKDMVITSKIKGALIREKLIDRNKSSNPWITVRTTNGVVYLSGRAESTEQINHAVRIAQSVDGVRDVNTLQLKVRQ